MDERTISTAFDYQRFKPNPGLEARIQSVYDKYFTGGTLIPDDALNLSAAGDIKPFGLHSGSAEGNDRDDR